jgi:hypothetical protein
MADEPTCGQGLAQHAELPRLMSDVMIAMADNLSAHVPGLVSGDERSENERRVYEQLVAKHREAAEMLQAIGTQMAQCHDMPMGHHDVDAMSPRDMTSALGAMVDAEGRLVARVRELLTDHRSMLDTNGP